MRRSVLLMSPKIELNQIESNRIHCDQNQQKSKQNKYKKWTQKIEMTMWEPAQIEKINWTEERFKLNLWIKTIQTKTQLAIFWNCKLSLFGFFLEKKQNNFVYLSCSAKYDQLCVRSIEVLLMQQRQQQEQQQCHHRSSIWMIQRTIEISTIVWKIVWIFAANFFFRISIERKIRKVHKS